MALRPLLLAAALLVTVASVVPVGQAACLDVLGYPCVVGLSPTTQCKNGSGEGLDMGPGRELVCVRP